MLDLSHGSECAFKEPFKERRGVHEKGDKKWYRRRCHTKNDVTPLYHCDAMINNKKHPKGYLRL